MNESKKLEKIIESTKLLKISEDDADDKIKADILGSNETLAIMVRAFDKVIKDENKSKIITYTHILKNMLDKMEVQASKLSV